MTPRPAGSPLAPRAEVSPGANRSDAPRPRPLASAAGRWLALALGLVCAALLQASTCVNQDFIIVDPIDINLKQDDAQVEVVPTPYRSRNTLDFVLTNTGTETMSLELLALSDSAEQSLDDDDDDDDAGLEDADPDEVTEGDVLGEVDGLLDGLGIPVDLDLGQEELDGGIEDEDDDDSGESLVPRLLVTLEPGQQRVAAFTEDQLGNGTGVVLLFFCRSPTCVGRLEFTVLVAQLECRTGGECSTDETCDATGRCVPSTGDSGGCQTPPGAPHPGWLALTMLALGLGAAARRRSRPRRTEGSRHSARRRARPWLLALCLGALLTTASALSPSQAQAQANSFKRPSAQTTLGLGTRIWTGALSADTRWGTSLEWSQALQFENYGFQLGVGTAFYLTTQEAPPVEKGLQTYSLRLGPRYMIPWEAFRFFVDVEYERLGVISNALARQTGPELSFNAVGGALGARYLFGAVVLDLRVSYNQVIEFQAGMLGITANVGIAGDL